MNGSNHFLNNIDNSTNNNPDLTQKIPEDPFPSIDPLKLNIKKIKKTIKKKLILYETLLRFKTCLPENNKKYISYTKQINDLFSRTLRNDSIYSNGNIYYVSSLLDSYLQFLEGLQKRIIGLNNIDVIKMAHDAVFECSEKLISSLENNLKNPITKEKMILEMIKTQVSDKK